MSVISLLVEFLTILCLPVMAGRELSTLTLDKAPESYATGEFCNITSTMMSKDGRWLLLRKCDYMPSDTGESTPKNGILLFDLRNAHRSGCAAVREMVNAAAFAGNTHLLLSTSDKTELFDLKKYTSIYFNGAIEFKVIENTDLFILHYNEEGKYRLELRDLNGSLLNVINDVSRFYVNGNGNIYAIIKTEKNEYEVYILNRKAPEKIYGTHNEIISITPDAGETGMMVFEKDSTKCSWDVLYLEFKTGRRFSLNDILNINAVNAFSEALSEGQTYYMKLWVKGKCEDSSLVDIWYDDDNKLEEKFYSSTREVYYVWEPENKKIQRIGNDTLIKNTNLGNERYFASCDPYFLQDYIRPLTFKIEIYDRFNNTYSPMDVVPDVMYLSPGGQYILYKKNEAWFNYSNLTGAIMTFGNNKLQTPYFQEDGRKVLFSGEGGLWNYNPEDNALNMLSAFNGYRVNVININSGYIPGDMRFINNTYDAGKPLVLGLADQNKNLSAYILWNNGVTDTIIPMTYRYIQNLKYDDSFTHFSYMEENYNLPPRVVYRTLRQNGKVVFQTNKSDTAVLSLRQEIISYSNSDGIPLKGILYYPLHYKTSGKYPMVVHIYARQNDQSNLYPFPSYNDELGFNIRLFLEKGYFIYLPDILMQGKNGPGIDALDCVNKALDPLAVNSLIDKHKVGLIGHSFGGYETDFIATHSRRFAAYVSGSGHSDIIWAYHAFNYNFFWPDYYRFETGQYDMRASFSADKSLYFENNPLFFADKVDAPVLVWSGLEDKNVTSDQSMAFYNALRRNGKSVIALFYKGEGHGIGNPEAQSDLTNKILDWFDYFLKDNKSIVWIDQGMKVKKKDAR